MSGLKSANSRMMRVAVAHVGDAAFDLGAALLGGERLEDRMQRRLGVLDHQQRAPRRR